MFFLCQHYSTVIFALQGAFLLKRYEQGRKHRCKTVQNSQMSAHRNIKKEDVCTVAYIL